MSKSKRIAIFQPGLCAWMLLAGTLISRLATAQTFDIAKIDQFLAAKQQNQRFNGNVLVAREGHILYQKSFGYADLERREPLSAESVFDIASITKEMTAAAVMICKDRGLLSLEDKLDKFFPELSYKDITVRHLLTHTSGLPEQNEIMFKYWDSERIATKEDLFAILAKLSPPAHFAPGKKFEYVNSNYSFLAGIIEKVSHMSYREFLQTNLFAPLQMSEAFVPDWTNAVYKLPSSDVPDFMFDRDKRKFSRAEAFPDYRKAGRIHGMVGASGVHCTAGDLLKWQTGLLNGGLLSKESLQQMLTAQVEANFATMQNYGFGIGINSTYGDTELFHLGGWIGYASSLLHFKKSGITIIVLTNNDSESGIADGLAAILFGKQIHIPEAQVMIDLPAEALRRFTGVFGAGNQTFRIELKGMALKRIAADGTEVELHPASATKLFYDDASDRQIEFEFENGQVKSVVFVKEGRRIELKKIE